MLRAGCSRAALWWGVGEGTRAPGRGGRGLWLVPALGRTIDPATVQRDLGMMKPAEWRPAFCNPWDDAADDGGWVVIRQDVWRSSQLRACTAANRWLADDREEPQ